MTIINIAAVLVVTDNLDEMHEFYLNKLGLALEDEQHGEAYLHYGCELGPLHFALHPKGNFNDIDSFAQGAVRIAFGVDDIGVMEQNFADAKDQVVSETQDLGWCLMMCVNDPDGNTIEIVQMRSR